MPNCSIQGCGRPTEGRLELCATHAREARKALEVASKEKKVYVLPRNAKVVPLEANKPKKLSKIAKVSGKMAQKLRLYANQKKKWIKGKKCSVFPHLMATDVHHQKGRVGFADKWARDNDIPLLLDERFWLPVSRVGHIKIESLVEWALEQGFSLPRAEIKD